MKDFIIIVVILFVLLTGCMNKKAKTEPPAETPALKPVHLDIPPDPAIFKATQVIKEYGKKTKNHLAYNEYQTAKKTAVFDPDVFYDHYVLDLNENNYWLTLTYRSAERSIKKDPRIEKLMENLPRTVIDLQIKTPSGKTYLLSDSNADGVLDFASLAAKKKENSPGADLQLLKQMQDKYRWALEIIKKYYKKK